jgi:hypothetical protein
MAMTARTAQSFILRLIIIELLLPVGRASPPLFFIVVRPRRRPANKRFKLPTYLKNLPGIFPRSSRKKKSARKNLKEG